MTTTYILKAANAGLGGGSFNKELSEGTETAGSINISVTAGTTQQGTGWTAVDNPGAQGVTGDYTVEANITTGNTSVEVSARLERWDQNENPFGPLATSAQSATQTATAGVKTFTFSNIDLGTWGADDRLVVRYFFANSSMMDASVTIETGTTDTEVVAPWTLAAGATVEPASGRILFKGYVPTLAHVIAPFAGRLSFKSYVPTIAHVIKPAAGRLSFKSYVPTLSHVVTPFAGRLRFKGHTPNIGKGVSPRAGRLLYKGYTPTITRTQRAAPSAGRLTFKSYAPRIAHVITPFAGRLHFKGYRPSTGVGVSPSAGRLTYIGHVPTLALRVLVRPAAGLLLFRGLQVTLRTLREVAPPKVGKLHFIGKVPTVTGSWVPIAPAALSPWSAITVPPSQWSAVAVPPSNWSAIPVPSSQWSAVAAAAASWSAVAAPSSQWSTIAAPSNGWSAVPATSVSWSAVPPAASSWSKK